MDSRHSKHFDRRRDDHYDSSRSRDQSRKFESSRETIQDDHEKGRSSRDDHEKRRGRRDRDRRSDRREETSRQEKRSLEDRTDSKSTTKSTTIEESDFDANPTKKQALEQENAEETQKIASSSNSTPDTQTSPKLRASKLSKWGPPANMQSQPATFTPALTAISPVPLVEASNERPPDQTQARQLAALLAARKAAELVNASMGVSGSMSAEDKKKLLWGKKKETSKPAEEAVANVNPAPSSTLWQSAHFADRDREERFQKLMGVKHAAAPPVSSSMESASALTEEKQREMQAELERQYEAGLRRRDGRTVGLGL